VEAVCWKLQQEEEDKSGPCLGCPVVFIARCCGDGAIVTYYLLWNTVVLMYKITWQILLFRPKVPFPQGIVGHVHFKQFPYQYCISWSFSNYSPSEILVSRDHQLSYLQYIHSPIFLTILTDSAT
jgi:hypothetical protein